MSSNIGLPRKKVPLDIRGIDDDKNSGKDSGVHLIPIFWKDRLFLFWPEFMEKPEMPSETQSGDLATMNLEIKPPQKYWEIKLAWSEYKDNKWTSKQVSKEAIITKFAKNNKAPHHYWFKGTINSRNQLNIRIVEKSQFYIGVSSTPIQIGKFTYEDIQSKNQTSNISVSLSYAILPYSPFFMSERTSGMLSLKSNDYLKTSIDHSLLYSHQITDFEEALKYF